MTQTYQNLDICVVDDGSKNKEEVFKVINVLLKEDHRVRFINFSSNMGKWSALNEAIRTTDAVMCTSHDADDVSLHNRIERQYKCLTATNTLHNLCGFKHCWNEDDVSTAILSYATPQNIQIVEPDEVTKLVQFGKNTPGINHYFTGNFETAGVSALFYKQIWDLGIRFNPPSTGLRVLLSEDSDFNFRVTSLLGRTSILAEQPYCYRRKTSTNKEIN